MRKPLIAANWKMNKTPAGAEEFITSFLPLVQEVRGVDIIIAPPFTALASAAGLLRESNVRLSAQNVFYEEKGAYTGEISAQMLLSSGCSHVIIGHSERRQYFNETDELLNRKAKAVIDGGLHAIFCIGETLDEREAGKTFDVISRELEEGIDGIDLSKIVVAYEPVWAIGTGKTATPEQAQEAHSFIREKLSKHSENAAGTRILYGGSVKPGNIKTLMNMEDIDGALVGGASLDPVSFSQIIKFNR